MLAKLNGGNPRNVRRYPPLSQRDTASISKLSRANIYQLKAKVRFEPGDEKTVTLVEVAGSREIYGFNALVDCKAGKGLEKAKDFI